MNKTQLRHRLAVFGAVITGAVSFASGAAAQIYAKPPNLTPKPAWNLSLLANTTAGTSTLRFSTTSWNNGTGPLQLEAGPVNTGGDKQQVDQRIFNSDGTSSLLFAGWLTYHPAHNHIHFDDYASYTLKPVNAPGGNSRFGQKTTFCVMDTTAVDTRLPDAPSQAVYSTCGNQIQGMSVGWGNTYGSHLAGQEIDFTENADGMYQLIIEVDPKKVIVESNENDNVSCALLSIKKPSTVTVLDSSGSCSTVTSITPKTVVMGTTIPVTITGFGFTQARQSPSRAATVRARSPATLWRTVTVPRSPRRSRSRTRNNSAGTRCGMSASAPVAVLPNEFTVTKQ